jgi:hypothetical protein
MAAIAEGPRAPSKVQFEVLGSSDPAGICKSMESLLADPYNVLPHLIDAIINVLLKLLARSIPCPESLNPGEKRSIASKGDEAT